MDPNDHRVIGNRMDLFHQQQEGPGMVFWHPRGFALYQIVEDYLRRHMRRLGFGEVRTPQLLARSIWEASGHWEKFGENMFTVDDDEASLALKPMSCPGHIELFKQRQRSFRDLPLRLCEFGACHRNEPSGAVLGLMRTRAFVQDDAHVFCKEDQIDEEVARFCDLLRSAYADFGFEDMSVGFSTRPALRAGSDAAWDKAEARLARAADATGLDYEEQAGEGAFYGPKLEFILNDSRGRKWQCGTIQLDYVLPERLGASFVDSDNAQVRPALIHHAVLGSMERFIAMVLEHHGGDLPLWLAPDQIVVASINDAQAGYARQVAAVLEAEHLRVVVDDRSERLAKKIVDARKAGIPVLMAVGAREMRNGTVAMRERGDRQSVLPLAAVADVLRAQAFR
jgi:threonyl-tRNA synthetase